MIIFLIFCACTSASLNKSSLNITHAEEKFSKVEVKEHSSLTEQGQGLLDNDRINVSLKTSEFNFSNPRTFQERRILSSETSETGLYNYALILMIAKLNKYISFVNIELPSRLETLASAKSITVLLLPARIGMPSSIFESFTLESIPGIFESRGLYSDFAVNSWAQTLFLFIIACSALILMILEVIFKAIKRQNLFKFWKNLRILARNWILVVFGAYSDDIVVYTYVQFQGFIANSLGFVECLFALFIGFCLLFLSLYLIFTFRFTIKELKQTRSPEKYNQFIQRWENFQILFWGFRERRPLAHTFYLVYILKIVASALISSILFELPVVAVSLQVGLTLFILIYIGLMRPLMRRINLAQLLIMEFLSLVAGSLMLALTILIVKGASVASSRIRLLGDLVIMANILQNCLIFAFLAIKLVIEAKMISSVPKEKKEKCAWLQLLVIPLQQAGLGFEEIYIPPFYIEPSYYLKGPPVSEKQGQAGAGLESESTEKVFIYKGDVIPEEPEPMRAQNLSSDNISQRTELPLYRNQSEYKQKEEEEDNADKPNLFISVQNGEDVPVLSHVLRAFSRDKRKVRVFNLAKKLENGQMM